jgi:hypothetical protein
VQADARVRRDDQDRETLLEPDLRADVPQHVREPGVRVLATEERMRDARADDVSGQQQRHAQTEGELHRLADGHP